LRKIISNPKVIDVIFGKDYMKIKSSANFK